MNVALSPLAVVAEALGSWVSWSRGGVAERQAARDSSESEPRCLERGAVLAVQRPLNRAVECLRGTLWVTHDGDPKDVVLEAGQTYLPERDARMLVQALSAAEFRVTRGS